MNAIQILETIKGLKGQFSTPGELAEKLKQDVQFKNDLNHAYNYFFGHEISGCNSCFFDAYIQLCILDLDRVKNEEKCLFRVKRGIIIRDKDYNTSNNMTYHTRNDSLALYHLKQNPDCINDFEFYPDNWKELINSNAEEKTGGEQLPANQNEKKVSKKKKR